MGEIINHEYLTKTEYGLSKPFIYCNCPKELLTNAVSINKILAEKLLTYQPERRSMYLELGLLQILAVNDSNPILKDFDVLFNPHYEVDILTLFISACRKKPFSLIWPGNIVDGKLQYSEEGFCDYKIFDIDAYDITCIV